MIAWSPSTGNGTGSPTCDDTYSSGGNNEAVFCIDQIDREALMRFLITDDEPQDPEEIRAGWREHRRAMNPSPALGRQFQPKLRLRQYQVSRR